MKLTNSSLKPSKKYYILPAIDDEYAVAEYLFSVLPIIINLLTCPLIILLSAFIITAVRMKGRLRTMHNILLACMAGTNLAVGIAAQPAFIAQEIYRKSGGSLSVYCEWQKITQIVTLCLCLVSLFHLVLIGVERYVAMKHYFAYY